MKEILSKLNQSVDCLPRSEFIYQNGEEKVHVRNIVANIPPFTKAELEQARGTGIEEDKGASGVYYFSEEIRFGDGLPSIKHTLTRDGVKGTEGIVFLNGELQCSEITRKTKKAREKEIGRRAKAADELLGSFLKAEKRMEVKAS